MQPPTDPARQAALAYASKTHDAALHSAVFVDGPAHPLVQAFEQAALAAPVDRDLGFYRMLELLRSHGENHALAAFRCAILAAEQRARLDQPIPFTTAARRLHMPKIRSLNISTRYPRGYQKEDPRVIIGSIEIQTGKSYYQYEEYVLRPETLKKIAELAEADAIEQMSDGVEAIPAMFFSEAEVDAAYPPEPEPEPATATMPEAANDARAPEPTPAF